MPDGEHPDALVDGPARGRAAGLNPGNRYDDRGGGGVRLHVLGEHLDSVRRDHPAGAQVATRTLDDLTRSIINRVDSPDLSFRWTVNPYRGCEHGCIYCYARPTHEMLGLSCGLDFETTIVAKPEAAALLRQELSAPRWHGEPIVMSGVTDPYQPVERERRITRGCLDVMAACRQPVAVVTKSALVLHDLDLLARLAEHDAARVLVSLTTLDPVLARAMEPRAAAPRDRLRTIERIADAGVPVSVLIAPIVPGLTDHEIPALLEAAAGAGATGAGRVLLRLPHQVKELFLDWLRRHVPERAGRIEAAIRSTRDGALNDSCFGARHRGLGPRAAQIAATFDVFARRHGLSGGLDPPSAAAFRRPRPDGQLGLFDS